MGRMEEILLILGIVILLFGSKKIPELAKGLGQGIREFKKASSGEAAKEAEKAKEIAKPEEKKPDAEKKES